MNRRRRRRRPPHTSALPPNRSDRTLCRAHPSHFVRSSAALAASWARRSPAYLPTTVACARTASLVFARGWGGRCSSPLLVGVGDGGGAPFPRRGARFALFAGFCVRRAGVSVAPCTFDQSPLTVGGHGGKTRVGSGGGGGGARFLVAHLSAVKAIKLLPTLSGNFRQMAGAGGLRVESLLCGS